MNWFITLIVWSVLGLAGSRPVLLPQVSTPISITSSLVVHWQTVNNAQTYSVKRSLVSGGPYTTIATGLTGVNFTDNTLAPKTTYFYVVSATNPVGESPNSSEVSGTTP